MLALFAALLCVLANGFFVAAEFALAKVRPTALEALAKEGDAAARRAFEITQRLDAYLSATQLGITLASLALGWLGEPAMEQLLAPVLQWAGLDHATSEAVAVGIGFAVISALHIVIGELVPKSLAIQRPEDVAMKTAWLLRTFFYATYPALWILNNTSNLVLRLMGLPAPDHAEGALSLEELRLVIQRSFGEVDQKKRELLERVLRATDRPVRAAMVPRVDMEIITLDADYDALLRKVRTHGFSRFPVSSDGDPDHITGYVYAKDLLLVQRDRIASTIESLRRDIVVVPESRTVGEVLDELQHSAISIALVVDEYGGTEGLVTLDDLVGEIIGTVRDEVRSSPSFAVEKTHDGSVVAHGGVPLDELALDGARFEDHEGAETVGRYILAALGRLPAPGDVLPLGGWDVLVEDVRARRVHRVRFRRITPSAETT
jgi:CBS domain containing-hemolysin-like protein